MKTTYELDEARTIAEDLEIDFAKLGFDLEQFRAGLEVEAEHGAVEPTTDVTSDDPLTTGKIALAHLKELPDYYTRLKSMETDASAGTPSSATEGSRKRRLGKGSLIGLGLLVVGVTSALLIRKVRARFS